jgi:histidinol-phosphate phosphatase family protein
MSEGPTRPTVENGPVAFLDRDGTLIVERHYLGDPEGVALEHGAVGGLKKLARAGYRFVVVSNQSGVGRGLLSVAQVNSVNERTAELLAQHGIEVLDWYFCPHAPEEGCGCRKPAPGLIQQALDQHEIDASRSVVIGDKDSDLLLAEAAGLRGILVTTGYGKEHVAMARTREFEIARDLEEVAALLAAGSNDQDDTAREGKEPG